MFVSYSDFLEMLNIHDRDYITCRNYYNNYIYQYLIQKPDISYSSIIYMKRIRQVYFQYIAFSYYRHIYNDEWIKDFDNYVKQTIRQKHKINVKRRQSELLSYNIYSKNSPTCKVLYELCGKKGIEIRRHILKCIRQKKAIIHPHLIEYLYIVNTYSKDELIPKQSSDCCNCSDNNFSE